ncbi:hypothetical protein [Promicromonospora sp. NFX87]|uniref:restriction endonuclease n=1 Tax=Promicromonospora sp. NFX87 TaxID=3402691 RepID=UPI003AFB5A38
MQQRKQVHTLPLARPSGIGSWHDFRVTTLGALLDDFLFRSTSEADRDRKFEGLVREFLRTDTLWSAEFDEVWTWEQWPDGEGDKAWVDLVARKQETGDLSAVRCVFHDPDSPLPKKDIEKFLSASGKAPFTGRLVVATTDTWDSDAETAISDQDVPVRKIGLTDLLSSSVDWTEFKPDSLVSTS